jgi:PAS domain S-box-containing protein
MNTKPTYEELEARIRKLELEIRNRKHSHEEERYRNVYNTAPLAFVIWDNNCKVVDWNKKAEKIFGWSKDEVLGRNFFDFLIPDDVRPKVEDIVTLLLEGNIQSHSVNENRTKKGNIILCEWNNSILYDDKGQIQGAMSLGLDITQQRYAQEELKKGSEKIKIFAYSIAHDLKNPSVSIYGLASRLKEKYGDNLDERGAGYCNQIIKSAEQISELVEMINQYITTKERTLCLEEVNPKEIFQLIREEFSAQLNIRQIDLIEPEDIPIVMSDKLAILRVFRNFIDNALKYGGKTLQKIEIGYENNSDFHIFSVYDDGIGLKKEESRGIFSLSKRKDTSRGIKGTGLGLAIVKEIAERHHGEVWAEPGPQKGITFKISFIKFF